MGTLVLTHLVPAPAPTEADEQPWVDQAAAAFGGSIVVARDLATIAVGEPAA